MRLRVHFRQVSIFASSIIAVSFALVSPARAQDVLTYHNDNARTGQNLNETTLTPANVNSTTFGKIFVVSTDGKVDAQPLYVSGVAIGGNGTHNLLVVASEHDSVYAFDADNGVQLWHVSLLPAGETTYPSTNTSCGQVAPELGITATPVIDSGSGPNGTIYVIAMSMDASGNAHQRLHGLDLTTGTEEFGGPSEITASYPGSGDNSQNGMVVFAPAQYKERASLLLLNGVIYTTWASHCDRRPYTGWIMGYSEATLAQVSVLNVTPNGNDGAFWSSGGGPAADSNGNIFVLDGNGTFDTVFDANGFPVLGDFGNGFLKITPIGDGLSVTDYFNMLSTSQESGSDDDLGSGGALLLPDLLDAQGNIRHLAIGAGKDGNLYIVDRDNMGKFNPNQDSIYQELDGALSGGIKSTPAYFNGTIYYGPIGKPIQAFQFTNGQFVTPPSSQTSISFAYPGASPSISANQSSNGILWATENNTSAVLHAYDATNLANEFYNSNQAAGNRDHFGAGNKFITPTVTNGKVYVGTTTGVGAFGILPTPTSTTLSSSLNPASPGQIVTFTAVVSGTSGIPTGTVTFSDAGATIGIGTLDGTGTATFATPALAAGTHSITAFYSGDARNASGTAPVVTQTVTGQTPIMTISSSLNPSIFGQTVVFSATLSSPSGPTPVGTATFKDTTASLALGTATLNTAGVASVTVSLSSLGLGAHTIAVTYSGDSVYTNGTASLTQTVLQAQTTTTLTSSLNPSTSGSAVTFTATVASVSTPVPPTINSVQFKDGSTVIGTVTLTSAGTATFTTSALAVGTHSMVAHYRETTNFNDSNSTTLSEVVNGLNVSATTALTSSLNPGIYGQAVSFIANVSSSSGPTPTGTITFQDATKGVTLGTITLAGGSGTFTTGATTLAAGSHVISATYSGDNNYSSGGASFTQTVNQATTVAGLSSTANPSISGGAVTFTATVGWSGPGAVTGSVDFKDGATIIGTVALNSSGTASLSTSSLSVGAHAMVAHYKLSTNFLSANSLTLSQIVNSVGSASTSVLTTSINPSVFGLGVTFTANVTPSSSGPTPTGTVTFRDTTKGVTLGTVSLTNGSANVTTSATVLGVGSHTISVTYSGDPNYTNSSASLTQTVTQATPTLSIASSLNPSPSGTSVTFITVVSGPAVPTGTVNFKDNGTIIATVTLDATGTATFTTSSLALGTHPITVHYKGNSSYMTATSTVLSQVVN